MREPAPLTHLVHETKKVFRSASNDPLTPQHETCKVSDRRSSILPKDSSCSPPPPPRHNRLFGVIRRGGLPALVAALLVGLTLTFAAAGPHARAEPPEPDYDGFEFDPDYPDDDYPDEPDDDYPDEEYPDEPDDDYPDEPDDDPDEPSEPGPTTATAVIETVPDPAEVMVGHSVKLTASVEGLEGDYVDTVGWSWSCPERPDELNRISAAHYTPDGLAVGTFCETEVGTRIYHCFLRTDLGREFTATTAVKILPPNVIMAVPDPPDGTQFPHIEQVVRFKCSRDGKQVGTDCCVDADFQERFAHDTDRAKPDWQLSEWTEWAPPLHITSDNFRWDCENAWGRDLKQADLPPESVGTFRRYRNGDLLRASYVQQVRLGIDKVCGGKTWVKVRGGFRVDERKLGEDRIYFHYTPMPAPPLQPSAPPPPDI